MMSAQTPEGKVKKKLTDMLKREGIWYFFPANNGFGRAGIPDVICIADGTFVGIECKADASKQPTALQILCGKEIRGAGGYWFLVYDDISLGVVEAWLRKWLRR